MTAAHHIFKPADNHAKLFPISKKKKQKKMHSIIFHSIAYNKTIIIGFGFF